MEDGQQYNGQEKKGQKDKQWSTKDWSTRILQKFASFKHVLLCSWFCNAFSDWAASNICRHQIIKYNIVIS